MGKYCILEKYEQSKALTNKFGLFQIQLWGLGRAARPGNFATFPAFKAGNRISSTETDTKLVYKYEQFFFLITSNLIVTCASLFFRKRTVPARLRSQYSKTWKQGDFKNPNSSTYKWIGENWKCNLDFHSKNSLFYLFQELGKTSSPARVTFKHPNISFRIGKTLQCSLRPNYEWIGKICVVI